MGSGRSHASWPRVGCVTQACRATRISTSCARSSFPRAHRSGLRSSSTIASQRTPLSGALLAWSRMAPELLRGALAVDDRGEVAFVNEFTFDGVKRFYTVASHFPGFVRAWHGHLHE